MLWHHLAAIESFIKNSKNNFFNLTPFCPMQTFKLYMGIIPVNLVKQSKQNSR